MVLTAAHCVDETMLGVLVAGEPGILTVSEYRWTRKSDVTKFTGMEPNAPAWPQDSVGGLETVVPQKWESGVFSNGLGQSYDIALLFLDEPVLDVDLGVALLTPTKEHYLCIILHPFGLGFIREILTLRGWATTRRLPCSGSPSKAGRSPPPH